jgi:hypothetical protein
MSKNVKIVLGVVGGFIAFVALIIVVAFVATSGPVKAVDGQLALLRENKAEEAYKNMAKDFQNAVSLEEFQNVLTAYPSLKNNASASWSSRSIENDTGTLQGELKAKDGGVTPITFTLVKENGEWRILNFEIKPVGVNVSP